MMIILNSSRIKVNGHSNSLKHLNTKLDFNIRLSINIIIQNLPNNKNRTIIRMIYLRAHNKETNNQILVLGIIRIPTFSNRMMYKYKILIINKQMLVHHRLY